MGKARNRSREPGRDTDQMCVGNRLPDRAIVCNVPELVLLGLRIDHEEDPASAQHTFRIVASDAIHSVATARLAARLPQIAPG